MNCSCDAFEPATVESQFSLENGNLPLAFGLTIGAGLATTLGALLPFCIDLNRPRFLAAALAGSAGV